MFDPKKDRSRHVRAVPESRDNVISKHLRRDISPPRPIYARTLHIQHRTCMIPLAPSNSPHFAASSRAEVILHIPREQQHQSAKRGDWSRRNPRPMQLEINYKTPRGSWTLIRCMSRRAWRITSGSGKRIPISDSRLRGGRRNVSNSWLDCLIGAWFDDGLIASGPADNRCPTSSKSASCLSSNEGRELYGLLAFFFFNFDCISTVSSIKLLLSKDVNSFLKRCNTVQSLFCPSSQGEESGCLFIKFSLLVWN
jgi:hypothetical protein